MKYLIVSDIHGNIDSINNIKNIVKEENIDEIIILGDLYHYGFYSNQEAIDELNKMSGIIKAVKGNCDSSSDIYNSKFAIENSLLMNINGRKFFFCHGHNHNYNTLPIKVDYYICGHQHINYLKELNDLTIANPGSISYPRQNTKRSYMIIDEYITIKDLDKNIIFKKKM